MCATQARPVLCRYLVHMVQLDAAAMNLKRRFEDPNITASLEAQQAYTRALAPGGDLLRAPLHSASAAPAPRMILPASGVRDAQHTVGPWRLCQALLGLPGALMRPRQGRLLRAPLRMAVSWP